MLKFSNSGKTIAELYKENKKLKDRNDELEFYLFGQIAERGRTKKRGRRTSR